MAAGRSMKVALVNRHYRLGGIETVVQQLWHQLPSRGIAAELWISEFGELPAHAPVHPLYPPVLNRLLHSRFATVTQRLFPRRKWTAREFERIRRSDCDIVHVHGFDETYADFEALVELARAKPMALTLHGAWLFTGGCGQPLGCERFARACGQCPQLGVWPVPAADNTADELEKKRRLLSDAPIHFLSPSLHLREKALRSTPGKKWEIGHLPHGVDTTFFRGDRKRDVAARHKSGLNPEHTVVLAMCRDFRDPVKGVSLMAGALKLLEAENVQVILAGAFAELLAAELPERLHPKPLGYIANDRARGDLFEIADVFFFTSREETFPCVILEAMSAECCVVSTPLEAVYEQLQPGVSGLLASNFTPEALALELGWACRNPARSAEIGRLARAEVIHRFSVEMMLSRHLNLYRRLSA
jgi:glycosyltransferase involved in cell wall biosynthesis